ncbi:MAG: hypothetical protein LBS07_04525 [Prevotellaceae bacterium]|jgi:hypothetical protein|nr:hypothetical protein [Prevotellaceae bacterium]
MNRNKQQIRSSFFNPVYLLLPLLSFRIVGLLEGSVKLGWLVAIPVALVLTLYVYFSFRKLSRWYLFSTGIFFVSCVVAVVFPRYILPGALRVVFDDVVFLLVFIALILFQKQFNRISTLLVSRSLPMSNNLSEARRVLISLSFIFLTLLFVYFISLNFFSQPQVWFGYKFVYIAFIGVFIVYETLRVKIVRKKLKKEKWWPIVSDQGKVVGSIEHYESLLGREKFLHPVVRVAVIKNNRIYLRKIEDSHFISPGLWDTAVSDHVLMNETVDEAVRRVFPAYDEQKPEYFFLSNYLYEAEFEKRYVFLFVTCKINDLISGQMFEKQTKWWTLSQIENNLKAGVFTEDFLIEFEIIKRAGFFDNDLCPCECKLKQVIYRQLEQLNKNDNTILQT